MENNNVREYQSIFGWGDKVRDILSSFEGRITGVRFEIGNVTKYDVQSQNTTDGRPVTATIHESQLRLMERCNSEQYSHFSGNTDPSIAQTDKNNQNQNTNQNQGSGERRHGSGVKVSGKKH